MDERNDGGPAFPVPPNANRTNFPSGARGCHFGIGLRGKPW